MYEYGCFISFWGNFDMVMEALIGYLCGKDATTNCSKINRRSSGRKREQLARMLKARAPQAREARNLVFDLARRNDWVHGVVLNPYGDFSKLTLFRAKQEPFSVTNSPIDFSSSPFESFYEAYKLFVEAVDGSLAINTIDLVNRYLRQVQDEDTCEPSIGCQ